MGVLVIMNVAVIPPLTQMYTGMNIELPFMTQMVMTMSKFFTDYILFMFIGLIAGILFLTRFVKTENGKMVAKKTLIKLGQSYNGKVEITEGLKTGDKVITKGYQDLEDGKLVTVF